MRGVNVDPANSANARDSSWGLDYCFGTRPPVEPAPPVALPKTLVSRLLRPGDPKQATNAARSLSEFIENQLDRLRRRGKPKHRPSAPPIDTRLWLDEYRYSAWTLCGHLVVIQPPKAGFGASPVRLANVDETRVLLAVNKLILTVISMYPGADLRTGTVTRFIADHRLEMALAAAHERALADECALDQQHDEEPGPQPTGITNRPSLKVDRHVPRAVVTQTHYRTGGGTSDEVKAALVVRVNRSSVRTPVVPPGYGSSEFAP